MAKQKKNISKAQSKPKSILWKAFFVFSVVFFVYGLLVRFSLPFDVQSIISIAADIVGLIALYSFTFNKKMFNLTVWKIVFGALILNTINGALMIWVSFNSAPIPKLPEGVTREIYNSFMLFFVAIIIIVGILLTLPILYAAYKLSFGSKK
jgi:hypothetical protein